MAVSSEVIDVTAEDLSAPQVIVASDRVMGNGVETDIHDIVFVRPENFSHHADAGDRAGVGGH